MDDLFEEDKIRKSSERKEVINRQLRLNFKVNRLNRLYFSYFMVFLQVKKFSRKRVETEIFEEDQSNLKKILDNQKKKNIEINLSDDDLDPCNDDVEEGRNLKMVLEVKRSENDKKDSLQEEINAGKVDNDFNVDIDTFDGVDISKYIKDNI